MKLEFERPVAADGYVWWYLDAWSDDGRHGITLIAFLGSVFSPYYAAARRRSPGAADPLDHCALNVALYGAQRGWSMTERGRGHVERSARHLAIGPSALAWNGDALTIDLDEVTVPLPARLRGRIVLHPLARPAREFTLDAAAGRHRWRPLAPLARVEVALTQPALAWSGTGYLDSNAGDEPLEAGFCGWNWSRAHLADGHSALLYDVTRRDGSRHGLALRCDRAGRMEDFAPPPIVDLPPCRWGVARATRAEGAARVTQTLEDAPFYARSVLATTLCGETVTAMHESLSLDRFAARWVQILLPFRMPRRR